LLVLASAGGDQMKTKDFQVFVEQLGDLSESQQQVVVAALKGKGSASDAIRLIERQFEADPTCGHCGARSIGAWGTSGNGFKYKCKCCSKTFTALTGTPLSGLHKRDRWVEYARTLVEGISLRKAAKRCRIDLGTSFRWRHRFLTKPKGLKAKSVKGIVEADETFFRKSAKGSRKLVGRAPRKRGEKAKLGLSTDDYAPVLIVRDRNGATTDQKLADLEACTIGAHLAPVVEGDAVLVSDGRAAYGAFAQERDLLHISIVASRGEHVYQGFHLQNVNNYASRLKGWMRRFNGVATKYLDTYLGWWRMIDRDGDRLTMNRMLAAASGHAAT
jgi:transposase-like protein